VFATKNTTLAEDYLKERDGNVRVFYDAMTDGQRLGQAFMNALSKKDYQRLTGTIFDCFYKTKQEDIYTAIEWLLDNE
jgi:hypothetical protein